MNGVSRETPPAPEAARGVFASRLPLARQYAASLAGDGVLRGLIGPREAPRLWERHLLNCAVLSEAIPPHAQVCDIGSGAGLPGLVLAIVRPDLEVTLVEPLLRRTTYLEEVTTALGLERVRVLRGKADDLHGTAEFDVVTSRAVAPLGRLLDWSMPLVRAGGALLAMKGSRVHQEVDAAGEELRRHGAGDVEVLLLGRDVVDPPTTALRVAATQPSRLGWDAASNDGHTGESRRKKKGRRS